MVAAAVTTLGAVKETFLAWTWPPAVSLARRAVLSIFSGLGTGRLLIIDDTSGTKHAFGQRSFDEDGGKADAKSVYTAPDAEIVVKRDSFWLRLVLFADIGFAEGYMLGDFECNDLTTFFRVRTHPLLYLDRGGLTLCFVFRSSS
jgi:cyclopropane-fatty-acyl-phospholipid synthase